MRKPAICSLFLILFILLGPGAGFASGPGICCLAPASGIGVQAASPEAAERGGIAVMDFVGLESLEPVADYYAAGFGGAGTGPGPNLGVRFSDNGLAIIRQESGGTGNFTNNPSGDSILFFVEGTTTIMNVADGFEAGFSFYYSAANQSGFVRLYSEVDGGGELLAELDLPITPPTGQTPFTFDNWVGIGVQFDGIARSVDFGGTADQIGFDIATLGTDQAGGPPPPPPPVEPALAVPLGSGLWWVLLGLFMLILASRALRRNQIN